MAKKEKRADSGGGIVSSILISFVAAVGVVAIGLGSGVGAGRVMYGPLDAPPGEATPAQEQQVQPQNSQGSTKSSYIGPNLLIENGEVLWSRNGGYQAQSTAPSGEQPESQQEDYDVLQDDPEVGVMPAQTAPEPDNVQSENQPSAGASEGSKGTTSAITPNQTQAPASSSGTTSSGSGNGNNFNTYNNQSQTQTTAKWVLNTNTKKIHYPDCRDVPKIAPQNYATSNLSEADLIRQGYTTCGHCH